MNLALNNISARAKYIRMSPTKVRRVLKQIQGRSYKEALMILEFMPYAACKPVLLVVQSAGAQSAVCWSANQQSGYFYWNSWLLCASALAQHAH